ncbi:hypothetical protein BpHYR1_037813 [Brachionus plicatilis]|uniref:Uncharacterized protein n=1 Tax=Brachionus plicatilis TaxID=10195 RepID=A0A3M7QKU9_BRAPC|nr:hypothetical protein BpHYR1_037813 [Brachionus plicatilis]
MKRDGGAAAQRVTPGVLGHTERGRVRLPNVLFVVKGRVEADAELSDEVAHRLFVVGRLRLLHLGQKLAGLRFGDGAQVVDHVLAGHADARVRYVQHAVVFVRFDADGELVVVAERVFIGQGHEAEFVERVRRVRYELAQKYLLVFVQRVDDQLHHAVDLGHELLLLGLVAQLLQLGHAQPVQLDLLLLALHHFVVGARALPALAQVRVHSRRLIALLLLHFYVIFGVHAPMVKQRKATSSNELSSFIFVRLRNSVS